jgi:LmbE family N-acetylglucosaminyl deacetylase
MYARQSVADRGLDVVERVLNGSFDRVLIVAAHPDDETIGAGVAMSRMRNVVVLHLTDGAPRDRNFVAKNFSGTVDDYAAARAREAREALALAHVTRVGWLGVHDLELVHQLAAATEQLARAIEDIKPVVVITHAYEGGHPDHDAAAFIVQHAVTMAVAVGEMALYHAANGTLTAGEFLSNAGPQLTIELRGSERQLKSRMIERFATQREVLAQFPIECERFRDAPGYDFRVPPHPGPLWYETLNFPVTGSTWRQLAAEAARQLGAKARR